MVGTPHDNSMDEEDDPDRTVLNASLPTRIIPAHRPQPLQPPRSEAGRDTGTPPAATASQHRPGPDVAAPPARRPALPAHAASLALKPGFLLHEYRIDSVLGQGGFGITYLATDINLNTRVAIKEYLPEEIAFRKSGQTVSAHSTRFQDRYKAGLDSFLVEGRTLASFRHPNIVRVARFFEAHQTAYMVLEYERGLPLKAWWPKHPLPEKELLLLLLPLLDGLSVVHATGFLHRDIKPDNIQVRRSDGSLVLLDFGSARQAVGSGMASDDVAVTPGYAPIEQYQDGDQGAWTDVYAMGATLYWMLTSRKPPDAMERLAHDTLQPVREAVVVEPGRWSDTFLDAIDWALKLQPSERPQSVDEWRGKLFAAHASSLGVQQALRVGDAVERRALGQRLRRVISPGSWPLALKLSLAGVAAALLPMLSTGYYNLQNSLDMASSAELRNLELLAQSTAGRMAQLITDSRYLARALGEDGDFVAFLEGRPGRDVGEIRNKMQTLVGSNPDIHLMMLMDRNGTAVVSSDPEVMGRNFAFREYFKSAMAGKPYTSGIIVGSVAGQSGMFYANPVFDEARREPIGAVVLRIRGSSFDKMLKEVQGTSVLRPFLIDSDGVVIGHADPAALYASLAPLTPDKLAEIKADQRFRRDTVASLDMPQLAAALVGAASPGHLTYRSTLTHADEVAGYAPVAGGTRWVVAVSEPRSSFEAPLNALFWRQILSIGLVGLLFLGLALLFARNIVRPVKALTQAIDALKAGDYKHATVKVESRDEIGQLSRTFNVLIDVLRQRERERKKSP